MTSSPETSPTFELDPKRWLALVVIAITQLMVVLDASIVNIALPAMQTSLDISDADRQWVVTAYTLAFGGLLLLGGRIADYAGRKRMLIVGLIGFAAASALGGISGNFTMLLCARALQGAFAALLAPAALSVWCLWGAFGQRGRDWTDPWRATHSVRVVALDPPRERAHRSGRRFACHSIRTRIQGRGKDKVRHPRCYHRHVGTCLLGLRHH